MMYSVECVDAESGQAFAVVVDAPSPEVARNQLTARGAVTGRILPVAEGGDLAARVGRIADTLERGDWSRRQEFSRRHPVWTIAWGLWLGWILITATVLTVMLVMIILGMAGLAGLAGASGGNQPPPRNVQPLPFGR